MDERIDRENQIPRSASLWLLMLGLAFAAIGQLILSFAPDRATMGIAAYAASLLVLLVLVRVARSDRPLSSFESRLVALFNRTDQVFVLQVGLTLLAVGCIAFTTVFPSSGLPDNAYWSSFYAWLIAVLALTIAYVYLPGRSRIGVLRDVLTKERVEVLAVVALTLVAFLLRFYQLTEIPYPIAGDEASVAMEGERILRGMSSNMFITGWQSEPSMSFLPWAIAEKFFGPNIFSVRLLAATLGALTIPALYILIRDMFNKQLALMSAALLAAMATHIHFSRIAVNNVENPLLACLGFWLIYRAVKTRHLYWFAAAGIVCGIAFYTFVGSRLVLILAGLYLVYAFVTDKSLWKEWPKFVVFGLTAGLIVLPLSLYFYTHLDIGFARMNQVGAFQTGWVAREMQATHSPGWLVLARNFGDAFLVFVSRPAAYGFYNSPGPMLDSFWSLFFVLGLIFSLINIREFRHVILQLWFWATLFFGGALILPPPFAERFAMAFPAVAALTAFGIWNVASLIVDTLRARTQVSWALMSAGVAVLAFTTLNFYFLDYTPKHYYADPNSEVGHEMGYYLGTVSRDSYVYFLGEPRMFYDFPTLPFLSRYLPGTDLHPGDDVTAIVKPGHPAIFIALPDRREDLQQIEEIYPGGKFWEVPRKTKPDEVLYMVYTVNL